jgi:hypothetical protein
LTDEIIQELIERIHLELNDIPRVLARMNEGWQRAKRSNDDYYLDGVALNLHGFYMGIERILTRIAETIDGKLPHGEGWHLLLLQQMVNEVSGIRPAVISTETGKKLDEYRKFRHVVRNVYTHNFDPAKLGKLVNSAPELFTQARAELLAFAAFLEQ